MVLCLVFEILKQDRESWMLKMQLKRYRDKRPPGAVEKLGNTRENDDMQREIKVLVICHGNILHIFWEPKK